MHKKLICIILSIFSIQYFCACEEKGMKNTESTSNAPSITEQKELEMTTTPAGIINNNTEEISMNVLREAHWSMINSFAEDIGKPLTDVFSSAKNIPKYNWYGGESQSMDEADTAIYHFSGPAWQQKSKCDAIKISGYSCFPGTWKDIITEDMIRDYFGDRYTYHPSSQELNGYFEYNFNGLSVIFYENNKGKLLQSDFCVLIRSVSESLLIDDIASLEMKIQPANDRDLLDQDKWGQVNKLTECLGKNSNELEDNNSIVDASECEKDGGILIHGYHIHDSSKPGLIYLLNNGGKETSKCIEVLAPAGYVFGLMDQDIISMSDLVNNYGVPFSWHEYEGYFYEFDFNGVVMYIDSDGYGNIHKDDLVGVKTQ